MSVQKKKETLESIQRVLESLSPEQGEYSYISDMSPLDAYVSKLLKVNKLKTRSSVYSNLNKIAIKGDRGIIEQYATETYDKIAEDYEESLHDVLTVVSDYEQNDLAYTRQVISASKILGLMKLSGKTLLDYEDEAEIFLDKSVWNKMSFEDLANFPQFMNDFVAIDDIKKRFDTKFMNGIVKLIDENQDATDDILDLLVMADIGIQMCGMFKIMSDISNKNSTLRDKNDLAMPDDDEDDKEFDDDFWDELEDEFSKKLKNSIFEMKSKTADDIASKVIEDMSELNVSDKYIENFEMLVKGKHLALKKDKDSHILRAAQIVAFYIDDELEKDERVRVSEALLPIAYVMSLSDDDDALLSDYIDLEDIRKFIIEDQDDEFEMEDFDDVFDDLELDAAIDLDYAIGSNVTTFYLGVNDDNEFYKALARKTIGVMSYSYFEDRNKKNYDSGVNNETVASILSADYKEFKDESELIQAAAKAIYSAINRD